MMRRIIGWTLLVSPAATPLVWVLVGDRAGLGYFLFSVTVILLARSLVPARRAQCGGLR